MTTSMSNKKIKVVFVLGGPASGKSTQCRKIEQLYGFTHLSPTDLLLTETGLGSEYSTLIHSMILNILNVGKLVPSELTLKLLQREMDKTVNYKFVVDGFPYDKENLAEWKNAMGIQPKLVLNFDCSEEVILSRLNEVGEGDLETIRKRFKRFSIDSPSLIEQFDSNGTLEKINAERSVEEVFEEIKAIFSRKNLDLDDCQLSKAFSDPTEMEALIGFAQPTALVAQPTEMLDQGLKRRSESELAHLTKKVKKQIVGPAKRRIRLALKELGVKQEDFTYLDGLTPKDYLNQLRDLVVMMAGKVDDHDLVAPAPIEFTKGLIPCDNMSMSQMVELGIKEVQGTLHCPHCGRIQMTKVDWREGFVCLASNLVGKMFKVGMKPPSNLSFKVFCSSCYKESVPCPSPDKGWDFLFLAFTYTVGLCPREAILGYLQEKQIEIPSEASQDILFFTFYLAILTQLDPTIDVWNYLRCSVAGAVSNGENA